MARPEGFEPTTPGFLDYEPEFDRRIFNSLEATVRCPTA
jgi:hypothetical protein